MDRSTLRQARVGSNQGSHGLGHDASIAKPRTRYQPIAFAWEAARRGGRLLRIDVQAGLDTAPGWEYLRGMARLLPAAGLPALLIAAIIVVPSEAMAVDRYVDERIPS